MTLVHKSYQRLKWTPSLSAKALLKIISAGIFHVQPIPLQSLQSISVHKHRWKGIEFFETLVHCLIQVKFKFLHPATMLLKLIRHKDLSSDETLRCELCAYDKNHSAAEMLS